MKSFFNPSCHFQQRVLQCQQPEGALNGRFRKGDEASVPASATSEAGHERELAVLLRGFEKEGQAGGAVDAGVHTHEGLDGACTLMYIFLHKRLHETRERRDAGITKLLREK